MAYKSAVPTTKWIFGPLEIIGECSRCLQQSHSRYLYIKKTTSLSPWTDYDTNIKCSSMLISILCRAPLCSGSFWASSSQSSPAPLYPSLRLWLTGEVMNIFVFAVVFVLLVCLCLTPPILGVQALVNRKMSKTFFIFPCVFSFCVFPREAVEYYAWVPPLIRNFFWPNKNRYLLVHNHFV